MKTVNLYGEEHGIVVGLTKHGDICRLTDNDCAVAVVGHQNYPGYNLLEAKICIADAYAHAHIVLPESHTINTVEIEAIETDLRRETARADKADSERNIWKAKAEALDRQIVRLSDLLHDSGWGKQ